MKYIQKKQLTNSLSCFFFNEFVCLLYQSFVPSGSLPYILTRASIEHVFPSSIKLDLTISQHHWTYHPFCSQRLTVHMCIYNHSYNSGSIAYGTEIPSLEVFHQQKVLAFLNRCIDNQLFGFFWFQIHFVNLFTSPETSSSPDWFFFAWLTIHTNRWKNLHCSFSRPSWSFGISVFIFSFLLLFLVPFFSLCFIFF